MWRHWVYAEPYFEPGSLKAFFFGRPAFSPEELTERLKVCIKEGRALETTIVAPLQLHHDPNLTPCCKE